MDPIIRQHFADADRAQVHERIARAVEQDPDRFLCDYALLEQSFGGRYVSADLFKELFADYAASRQSRNRYNVPVHNAAAVLSAEQLRRRLADRSQNAGETVICLTGTPGAGKTSFALEAGLCDGVRAIFEGQFSRADTTFAKLQAILDAGCAPCIVVVHVEPEIALRNTLQRFEEIGRGASVGLMAKIQGELPNTLGAVRGRFGERVGLTVIDRRVGESSRFDGWESLDILRSEGTRDEIEQRLRAALAQRIAAGLPEDARLQALGEPPAPILGCGAMVRKGTGGDAQNRDGSCLPEPAGRKALLSFVA